MSITVLYANRFLELLPFIHGSVKVRTENPNTNQGGQNYIKKYSRIKLLLEKNRQELAGYQQ